ncbi:IS200/IS605 family transposase [Dyadobacter sp. OTU695]|uniref:IS200/IS605 family transposase n=1 Tax=Dyadobacter sp. OTU695 TaxID=3043860 RepID=UPI00313C4213
MANTYSQIYLQFVFSVKHRQCLIPKYHKEELHRYITGLVQNRNAKMLAIHCMPDHTHIFVGFKPALSISDFIKEVKNESNEFVNQKRWTNHKFGWQEGYGAFSYSRSDIDRVVRYIHGQEEHHRKHSFAEEYRDMLQQFEVPFEEKYLFEFFDED